MLNKEHARRNFLQLWDFWENSCLDLAKASHTQGIPWTTMYDKKMPSISSWRAKNWTSKSALFQTKICKKLRLACCYALHVKWLRLACCGRRRGELVLLGYSQRCSSPRKYTNTQIHKNNIRHKHSLVQIVAKSYTLHVKLNLASKPNFLKNSDIRTSKECFKVSATKIHKYTSTQIHHTTQIQHRTQIQLGSNRRKKLRLAC